VSKTGRHAGVSFIRPYARGYYHGSAGYAYRPGSATTGPTAARPVWLRLTLIGRTSAIIPAVLRLPPWLAFGLSYGYIRSPTSVAVTIPIAAAVGAGHSFVQRHDGAFFVASGGIQPDGNIATASAGRHLSLRAVGRSVPMPDGSRPMPMTPPVPYGDVTSDHRVSAHRTKGKIAYPAMANSCPPLAPTNSVPIPGQEPG